ncbi:MAG: class I SAM-dependent RNA methyltransferase [Bacteroidales bacterium]|nr:MAG: class I SAM-dependent RNA methyltransferase [Bacteroidales bacterium]
MIPKGCIEECRGCKHREWSMEASLEQKFNFLVSKLSEWKHALSPVISAPDAQRWGYRFKTMLNAKWDENGWHFGTISRDELIDIPECPLHKNEVNRALGLLRDTLPSGIDFPLAFYVQASAQVVLIVKSRGASSYAWFTDSVKDELITLGVRGLWVHYNPSAGRRLYEKTHWELLFGEKRSIDSNGLLYGPGTFQQLIPSLYKQSLDEATTFFSPTINHAIVDLYCGTGTSMSRWVALGASVMGVEVGGEAVECAKLNAPQATILRGACRQRIPQIRDWVIQQKNQKREVYLYVNPPRTGIEQEVLDWIAGEGKPNKIAYLSCSAGTLFKNLAVLTQNGYKVCRLIPYDFFPQTIHVECLALIEKV